MGVKILMFHRVLPEEEIIFPNAYSDRGTLITLERFRRYLDEIAVDGSMVITLREWKNKGFTEHEDFTILTFDDGYKDNFDYILPELEARGWKGVFFPAMGCCETNQNLPLDRYYCAIDKAGLSKEVRQDLIMGVRKKEFLMADLQKKKEIISSFHIKGKSEPRDRLYMNMEELGAIHEKGHEIGGHTHWHELLTGEPTWIKDVLMRNAESLKELTGENEFSFAWPDGRNDESGRQVIRSTPFFCACDVRQEWWSDDRLFRIPRLFCAQN